MWFFNSTFADTMNNKIKMEVTKLDKNVEYVYDISLDGTIVNALGINVLTNTDGFNFKMPDTFRYTDEHPYIGKGLGRNSVKDKE